MLAGTFTFFYDFPVKRSADKPDFIAVFNAGNARAEPIMPEPMIVIVLFIV